jgi:hypothetical protein
MAPLSLYYKEFYYVDHISDKDRDDVVNTIGGQINSFMETKGFTVTTKS